MIKFNFKKKENVPKNSHRKKIWMGIGIACLAVFLAALIFIVVQIVNAPDISEIDARPNGYLTTILDSDENVMKNLYVAESNRVYVSLDSIPIYLQKAFIAIEDARFYTHFGIDIKGIVRAAFLGIKNGFKFSQGASTLTQQLLKNNVFEDWMGEVTLLDRLQRKIQEQYLAIRLEQKYDKDWILENYLNTINLGGGTRGVQVAAQYYFGKDVSQLTLAEASLIAGITKNPTRYNPLKNPEESLERQHLVLNAMLEQECISQEEYDVAIAEDVIGNLNTDSENRGMQTFSWFEDAMLEQIVADLMGEYEYTQEEAWNKIYTGGLTIYSTQHTEIQKACESVATSREWYRDDEQISVVMIDVKTGAVAAIIGGSDKKANSLAYNRATEAIRQPGSTIKMIGEYAAAFDKGMIQLGSVIDDAPYAYSNGTEIHNAYGTYKGMTTIRQAIASSSNIVALKAFQLVGLNDVFAYLQKFGITTLTDADKYEALAIGGTYNGVTNLEMTAAYNTIANSGNYTKPYYYTKVLDREGKVLLETTPDYEKVINEDAAALLTSAMQEVLESGTGTTAFVPDLDLAGKSGTTNDNRDVWFVGFSSYYTCGVWGGYDNNAAQPSSGYVKEIWKAIMERAHEGKEKVELVDEDSFVRVEICTKCGNRAVSGLCDKTEQGDMTAEEYFLEGTEPERDCSCHVEVKICKASGMQQGVFCPKKASSYKKKVYLKTATEGTEDENFLTPEDEKKSCDLHTSFWGQWFDNNPKPTDEPEKPNGGGSSWFQDFLDGLFG